MREGDWIKTKLWRAQLPPGPQALPRHPTERFLSEFFMVPHYSQHFQLYSLLQAGKVAGKREECSCKMWGAVS